jgi:hypothetical protein
MATEKDIETINAYKSELAGITQYNYNAWHSKVLATLKNVLGQDNDLTKQFFNTSFIEWYTTSKPHPMRLDKNLEESHSRFNKALGITRFVPILEAVIDYLEKHQDNEETKIVPVMPPTKNNFLSHLSTLELLFTIVPSAVVILGVGYYFGTEKINKDAITNERNYNELRDSVRTITSFRKSNNISDKDSDNQQDTGHKEIGIKKDTTH